MPVANVKGAEIYYEVRGGGPPLLFICGAFADVGHFTTVAELLSNEFTVVTYDRRGNSRSGGLRQGEPTTADEQADDAAALLKLLALAPANIYGNSSGTIIALNLLIRYPEVVRAAMLHEPPLGDGMADPSAVGAALGELVQGGMARGGPPAAAEKFLRFAMGDTNWESLGAEGQERARSNADAFFGSELGHVDRYSPGDEALRQVSLPVQVLVSDDGLPFCKEVGPWLAGKLGAELVHVPGTHTPQLDHPADLAQTVRAFLTSAARPA